MIRQAMEQDIPQHATDETLIRIIALKIAYGCNVSFIQFFTDENGGYLSIMDDVGLLYVDQLTDEWCAFLQMNPMIRTLHCPGLIGQKLMKNSNWQGRVGEVLRYCGPEEIPSDDVCVTPYLPDVHALLGQCFPGVSSLNFWYPDASHRIRHDCCHIGCIQRDNRIVSTAMTVAETETAGIIGQVATVPGFRRQGMAEKCIKSVISQCKGKSLYILPLNEYAKNLYLKMGFVPCGSWAELNKL